MTIDEQLRRMARQANQRQAITAEEIVQRASRQSTGSLTTRFRFIDRWHVLKHRPVQVSNEEATMLDVETPTPSPTDERRNRPKWVMLGVLAAAAAVIAIAVVAIRKDEPVNSVDTEAAVPSTAPHPLVGAWQVANIYTIYQMSFTSDGVVTEVDPLTSGVGVWEPTGPNTAAVTLMVPLSDDAGTSNGGAAVAQWRYTFEVAPDGQSAAIDWEAQVFVNGEPTGDHFGPGSDIATRINVEELGTPWVTATSAPTTSN